MNSDDPKKVVDFLSELMERQGAAASTVKNGHVLLFKRSFLQNLLDTYKDKDSFSIFLKRPDLQ